MATTYVYDEVGNRTRKIENGQVATSTYDGANQLEWELSCDGPTTYIYDECGNRTEKHEPAAITYYSWDGENRLDQAQPPAGPVDFAYNADNKRFSKETNCQTTKYVWDFQRLLQETDGEDDPVKSYTSTIDEFGDLVSEYAEFEEETAWPHFDGQGSTDVLILLSWRARWRERRLDVQLPKRRRLPQQARGVTPRLAWRPCLGCAPGEARASSPQKVLKALTAGDRMVKRW